MNLNEWKAKNVPANRIRNDQRPDLDPCEQTLRAIQRASERIRRESSSHGPAIFSLPETAVFMDEETGQVGVFNLTEIMDERFRD
jgi:hypothetical protein